MNSCLRCETGSTIFLFSHTIKWFIWRLENLHNIKKCRSGFDIFIDTGTFDSIYMYLLNISKQFSNGALVQRSL